MASRSTPAKKAETMKQEPTPAEEIDLDLINPADVEADPFVEDENYDESLSKIDPETQGEAEMEPNPGEAKA